MWTLYKTSKPGHLHPQLCELEDIQSGDTVFIDGTPIVVGEPPKNWSLTLTDDTGKVWEDAKLDRQVIPTDIKGIKERLAAALNAESPVYLTDGTVTRRIVRAFVAEGAEKDLPAPLCDKDTLGVLLEAGGVLLDSGDWAWFEADEDGELTDIGLVALPDGLYLAPLWWIKA